MTRSLSLLLLPLLAACTQPRSPVSASATDPQSQPGRIATTHQSLESDRWQLQEATDAQGHRIDALLVRPNQPIQLDIADGRIRIANTCNSIGGDVRIHGGTVHVGPLLSTRMACADPAVMALDAEISKRLEGRIRFRLLESDPPQLLWTAANGDTLRFVGTATPETRFGNPGSTVFMEVAAHTKPCQHPMMPALQQCLEVRERQYDAQGLPLGTPGEWQLFHDTIEGYTHEEGVRNVLRIKRYPIANPPMDAPAIGYVLEMVVESATVDP